MRIAALMRHAEPEDPGGEDPMALGHDRRLTELGRRQCAAAREWLEGLEPVSVVASDSPRAIETAQLVGAPLEPRIMPDLAGMRLGDWEQRPLAEVRDQVARLVAGRLSPPPGAESVQALADRVRRGFRQALPPEGNVLIVAHRLVNAVLLAEHLGLSLEQALRVPQDHAGVSLLSLDDTRDQLLALNVTPLTPLRLERDQVEDL
jgi:broad specificity phosphatase PhoE